MPISYDEVGTMLIWFGAGDIVVAAGSITGHDLSDELILCQDSSDGVGPLVPALLIKFDSVKTVDDMIAHLQHIRDSFIRNKA